MTDDQQPQQEDVRPGGNSETWEREMLRDLAFAWLKEHRRSRRWNLVFKSLFLLYLVVVLFLIMPETPDVSVGRHTALIDINGLIAEDALVSADNFVPALRAAFEDKKTAGVILRANSPGGSPVQAGYLYDELMRLRQKYPDTPVYAVVSDLCASACYYIASAADKIYANRASLVGSIGVLYDGFGFTGLIDKVGIERRLLTSGSNKAMMDPFSPVKEDDVAHFQDMLSEIHQQFIAAVKKGRGERLKQDPEIFSGLIWTGTRSIDLGLVDGLASAGEVARDVIGHETVVDYTPEVNVLRQLTERLGAAIGDRLLPAQGGAVLR